MHVARGVCHSIYVYDAAFAIDLNEAERRITSFKQRETIRHKRRAPKYFDYQPAPLRVSQSSEPIEIAGTFRTNAQVEMVLYDFGAVSVIYRIPLEGPFSNLLLLSEGLYEHAQLLNDSRSRVQELLKLIESAFSKPNISGFVEDYAIFQIGAFTEPVPVEDLSGRYGPQVAQVLRAESRQLSADEVRDALSHRVSYSTDDVAIVDWNAALVVDDEPDDVLTILEFANVELLEMRFLDQRLDDALNMAHERLSKRARVGVLFRSDPTDLRDISQWQMDAALLFEGVNNVLKLLGDQYLARLYRLAAERFHLSDWDASILRKLQTVEGIYQKISDLVVSRRMETLEWIIIVLIAVSIVLPFVLAH